MGVLKRPRTHQEQRYTQDTLGEEFAPSIRAKRNLNNLPDYWDDVYKANLNVKSWKSHRKTQYREAKTK